jgi:hypothetical protein
MSIVVEIVPGMREAKGKVAFPLVPNWLPANVRYVRINIVIHYIREKLTRVMYTNMSPSRFTGILHMKPPFEQAGCTRPSSANATPPPAAAAGPDKHLHGHQPLLERREHKARR